MWRRDFWCESEGLGIVLEVRGFTHHCFSTARLNDCSTVVKLNLLGTPKLYYCTMAAPSMTLAKVYHFRYDSRGFGLCGTTTL